MRKEFAELLYNEMGSNPNIVLLTADLGYGLWDRIKIDYPNRFFDFGAAEQLMIGAAAGMAMEGLIPVCYSITPFLLCRPYEFIRNLIVKENLSVKLIGGGTNRDYGNLGFTHWAEDAGKICYSLGLPAYFMFSCHDFASWFSNYINAPGPKFLGLTK